MIKKQIKFTCEKQSAASEYQIIEDTEGKFEVDFRFCNVTFEFNEFIIKLSVEDYADLEIVRKPVKAEILNQVLGNRPSREEWDNFMNSKESTKLAKEHKKLVNKQLFGKEENE